MSKAPPPPEISDYYEKQHNKKRTWGGGRILSFSQFSWSNETTRIGDTKRSLSIANSSSLTCSDQHFHYGSIMMNGDEKDPTVNVANNDDDPEQQQRRASFDIDVDFEIPPPTTPEEQLEEGTSNNSNNIKSNCDTSSTSNSDDDNSSSSNTNLRTNLTSLEIWNLVFCILAWACTIANVTLVVGTSNVVLLSIDGDPNLSSVPLATFFMGASLVSFLITPWHFMAWGRQRGFLAGVASGLLGSILGCLAVIFKSTPLLIVATTLFGFAMGIGFYLRFAAVEVVPKSWADKAVTLVVSGGCIAAFAGPESSEGTRGIFGPDYEFLGVFVMTGLFNLANGIFTYLVQFPDSAPTASSSSSSGTSDVQKPPVSSVTVSSSKDNDNDNNNHSTYWQRVIAILKTRHFIIPMLISAGSWIIMAFPMSVLRVAMHEVGFTSRQSLMTIELHFLGMYAPGFVSGRWIARYGPRLVAIGSSCVFSIAVTCLLLANHNNITFWIVGMVSIGIGWNCAFSGATVGSTRSYVSRPDCKSAIQAANDGMTFLLAGAIICCASSIYQAGGEGLEGWRIVNWMVVGFIGIFSLLLILDIFLEKRRIADEAVTTENPSEMWSTASMPLSNSGKAGK